MDISDQTIPQQATGHATNFIADKAYNNPEAAHAAFRKAAERLLTVNRWHQYAGPGSAKFSLADNQGRLAQDFAREGALFSISLPVIPGPAAGNGLEWVMIERLEAQQNSGSDEEYISMTVRPIPEPHKSYSTTAHFYKDVATSTFIVKREGTKLTSGVYGRNETPNNDDVGLHDAIRNTIVALAARIGLAGPQWKMLAHGLLEPPGLEIPGQTSSSIKTAARVLLGANLILAGIGHLSFARKDFQAQVPNWVPLKKDDTVVYSGFAEIALGSALAFAPAKHEAAIGKVAACFFAAVFPGNIAQYTHRRSAFGLNTDNKRLARLFFQPALIWWALKSTNN